MGMKPKIDSRNEPLSTGNLKSFVEQVKMYKELVMLFVGVVGGTVVFIQNYLASTYISKNEYTELVCKLEAHKEVLEAMRVVHSESSNKMKATP
jgi:Mn2+/Fe2+ NRAMP family transporter